MVVILGHKYSPETRQVQLQGLTNANIEAIFEELVKLPKLKHKKEQALFRLQLFGDHDPQKGAVLLKAKAFNMLQPFRSFASLIPKSLNELDCSYNQFTSLPDSIGQLVNLEKLACSQNQLTSLPDSIGQLVNLKELYYWNNKLTNFPDSIGQLVNLEKLDCYNNKLTSLPESIDQLVNLKILYCYHNQLTSLPDSIGQLVNLKHKKEQALFRLQPFRSFAPLIPKSLKELYCDNNKLINLPEELANIPNLKIQYDSHIIKPKKIIKVAPELIAFSGDFFCPICQSHELTNSSILLPCYHSGCLECYSMWLETRKKLNCLICQKSFSDKLCHKIDIT